LARERQPEAPADPAGESDAALVKRVAAGDRVALATLVGRHLPLAITTARRMLRDDAEAEDMAQEALIRLWRSADRVEVGPAGLAPWLRRVVANLCIDRIRASRNTDVTDEVPDVPTAATQLDSLVEAVESLLSRGRRALKAVLANEWRQLLPDKEESP
jgi:RNA polymerase sigma-70 factor (ECF subfamily)